MFGDLIVARNSDDANLHLYTNNPDDQINFFKKAEADEPAIFKMPECSGTDKKLHLGDYYTYESSILVVEPCPGQILTVQSTLNASNADDENSWSAYLMRNSLKIAMTAGLLGTGVYQYFQYQKKQEKKKKDAESSNQSKQGGRKSAQQMQRARDNRQNNRDDDGSDSDDTQRNELIDDNRRQNGLPARKGGQNVFEKQT